MITRFGNKSVALTNQQCQNGCGSFRAPAGTVCPACDGPSKAQASVATEAPGGPPETKDDF